MQAEVDADDTNILFSTSTLTNIKFATGEPDISNKIPVSNYNLTLGDLALIYLLSLINFQKNIIRSSLADGNVDISI